MGDHNKGRPEGFFVEDESGGDAWEVSSEGLGGGIQNVFGLDWAAELPGAGFFLESPEELAGKEKLANMAAAARQYESYRAESALGRQQAIQNMAGMMGGLNEFVQTGTGYGIDLEQAVTPVVSGAARQPPPPRPNYKYDAVAPPPPAQTAQTAPWDQPSGPRGAR